MARRIAEAVHQSWSIYMVTESESLNIVGGVGSCSIWPHFRGSQYLCICIRQVKWQKKRRRCWDDDID